MNNWVGEFDFEKTIRDFDYTVRAEMKLRHVYDSDEFYEEDAQTIFGMLYKEMELVSFGGYLKRYIYECAMIPEAFHSVPDKEYQQIMLDAFRENNTPFSRVPTTRKPLAIVKNWLSCDNMKREHLFLLGFGLNMSEHDVSIFLMKVLKEQDFDAFDPEEVIYWYCYRKQKGYAYAKMLLEKYEALSPAGLKKKRTIEDIWKHRAQELDGEDVLIEYLKYLKTEDQKGRNRQKAKEQLDLLLDQVKIVIADYYTCNDEGGRQWQPKDISGGDIENIICCGIPKMKNGNLQKVSASTLARHFDKKRMSRQRLEQITSKKAAVERFDLITLQFFLYAMNEDLEDPVLRYEKFVKSMNKILNNCGMMELYSPNPYEAFIQMCLLTEGPLAVYSDIWEMSYEEE